MHSFSHLPETVDPKDDIETDASYAENTSQLISDAIDETEDAYTRTEDAYTRTEGEGIQRRVGIDSLRSGLIKVYKKGYKG